jgi:hypothetical protein
MPRIRKKITSKASWNQDQLNAALAAVGNGEKYEKFFYNLIFMKLL